MATGERLTLTYSHPPSGPLKLDLYVCVPPIDPIDPSPNLEPLPFILYLHGGHFFTGSRRDVPPWLVSLARSLGTPLLCADYRLAPHAGPSHALQDVKHLWAFIRNDLKWIIACCGNGSEVESGTEPLAEDFTNLQNRGGVDPSKGVVVGLGSGGYLSAIGGACLSPPPIALVLGYPTLQFDSQPSESSSSSTTYAPLTPYGHILDQSHIGNVAQAKSTVPDVPMLLERAPYAVNVLNSCGMNAKGPWPGKEESECRRGVVEYLLKEKQWAAVVRRASPDMTMPFDMLANNSGCNRPYPPTIIYHGLEDSWVPWTASQHFIESIRKSEPVAAAVDALAVQPDSHRPNQDSSSEEAGRPPGGTSASFKSVEARPNHTSRYLFLGIQGPGAGHAFDALLPRTFGTGPYTKKSAKQMGDRYKGGMIHIEHFIRHWLAEGSTVGAAKEPSLASGEAGAGEAGSGEWKGIEGRGARVKVPRGGPRL